MSDLINVRIKDTVDPDKWYSGRKGTVLSVVDGRDGTYEYNNINRVSFIDKEDCEEVFRWNFPGAESEGWITKSELSYFVKTKPVEDGVNASFPETKKPLMVRVKCHPDKDIEGEVFEVHDEHDIYYRLAIPMGSSGGRFITIPKHDCEVVHETEPFINNEQEEKMNEKEGQPEIVKVEAHIDKTIGIKVFNDEGQGVIIEMNARKLIQELTGETFEGCEIINTPITHKEEDKIKLSPRADFREITYKHKANKEVIKHAYFHQWGKVFVSRGESKMVETVAIVELMNGSIMSLDLFDYVITFE